MNAFCMSAHARDCDAGFAEISPFNPHSDPMK